MRALRCLSERSWLRCALPLLQIKYGGTVPRSYYVQDSVKVQYDNSVTISRGSIFQLEYDVEAPSSLLRYKRIGSII